MIAEMKALEDEVLSIASRVKLKRVKRSIFVPAKPFKKDGSLSSTMEMVSKAAVFNAEENTVPAMTKMACC